MFSLLALFILFTSLLISSNCFAAFFKDTTTKQSLPNGPRNKQTDRYYVGMAAGYDFYRINKRNIGHAPGLIYGAHSNVDANGALGGVFAGYGHYFNKYFYLGGEVFLNYTSADEHKKETFPDGTLSRSTFAVDDSFGISLLPGINIKDKAIAYARLGYTQARMRGQETIIDHHGTTLFYSSKPNWSSGLTLGVGFEGGLYNKFSLRGEYTHTYYNSFIGSSVIHYAPADDQFMLGLIYRII